MGNCASGTKKTYNTSITGVNSVNDEQQPDNSPPLPHDDITYASIDHSGSKPGRPRATVDTDCDYATVCVPRPPDSDQPCRDYSLDSLESDQSSKDYPLKPPESDQSCKDYPLEPPESDQSCKDYPLEPPESDQSCKEPPDSEQTSGEDCAADQYIYIY